MPYQPVTPAQKLVYDEWRFLNKDLISPDSFIDFGLYFMSSAALQRRVWFGSADELNVYRLFTNLYGIMVAPPSVGKSTLLWQISSIIKHHKLGVRPAEFMSEVNISEQQTPGGIYGTNIKLAQEQASQAAQAADMKLLIPCAPESVTAEELFRCMNSAMLAASYIDKDGKKKKDVFKSLAFLVEELSMLFKAAKETKTLISFLLLAYDCKDFDHGTKTQGYDRIRKMCMNMLAGVQPGCLNDLSNSFLIGEGFASRTIFLFEYKPRRYRFGTIVFNAEQYDIKRKFIERMKVLNSLYGEIKFGQTETPEAFEILRKHIEDVVPYTPANSHPVLAHYYGRKGIHVTKLAAAIHFSYSNELTIFPEDAQFALDILADLEIRMHHALTYSKNPLASVAKKVLLFLQQHGPTTKQDLLVHFYDDVRLSELDEILLLLLKTDKIANHTSAAGECYAPNTDGKVPIELHQEIIEETQMGVNQTLIG